MLMLFRCLASARQLARHTVVWDIAYAVKRGTADVLNLCMMPKGLLLSSCLTLLGKQVPKHPPQEGIVWLVLKAQRPAEHHCTIVIAPRPNRWMYSNCSPVSVTGMAAGHQVCHCPGITWMSHSPDILEVRHELRREPLAQALEACFHLLLADLLVLLLLGGCLQPLPGQAASQEVHEYIPQALQVITPAGPSESRHSSKPR